MLYVAKTTTITEEELKQILQDWKKQIQDEMFQQFEKMRSDVQEVKSDVQEVKSDVHEVKSDVQQVKSDVQEVKSDVQDNRCKIDMLVSNINETIAEECDEKTQEGGYFTQPKKYVLPLCGLGFGLSVVLGKYRKNPVQIT